MAKSFNKSINDSIYGVLNGDTQGIENIQDTQNIENTENTEYVKDKPNTKDTKKKYYRFNLKMPAEFEPFCKEMAYELSDPTHTVTMTEYINSLIEREFNERNNRK